MLATFTTHPILAVYIDIVVVVDITREEEIKRKGVVYCVGIEIKLYQQLIFFIYNFTFICPVYCKCAQKSILFI